MSANTRSLGIVFDDVAVSQWRFIRAASMAAMMIVMVGCGRSGPASHPVYGKVTFQGKPVASGLIRFSNPGAGIDIMADLQAEGAYSVKTARGTGLPEGNYQVAIEPPRIDAPVGTMVLPPQPKRPDIPQRYRRLSSSGLALTVQPGQNSYDVDMRP